VGGEEGLVEAINPSLLKGKARYGNRMQMFPVERSEQ
jgi:hypothetical protein